MAWAIITIYASKCTQVDPDSYLERHRFIPDGVMEIFRCHPHWGLKNNKQNFVFNASRDWKPMEMFLDVVEDMGVTGKSGNESCSCVQYCLKGKWPGLRKTDQ